MPVRTARRQGVRMLPLSDGVKARRFPIANITISILGAGWELVTSDLRHSKRRWTGGVGCSERSSWRSMGPRSPKAAELAQAIARRFRSDVLVVHIQELAYTRAQHLGAGVEA